MRILIAGDGETGTHLAKMLSAEGQDIMLLGENREHLENLEGMYNFLTHTGDPLSPSALQAAGVSEADLFVAVTPSETVNLLSSQIARTLGASSAVARIDNAEFIDGPVRDMFARSGIDTLVYPERLAAEEIVRFVGCNWVTHWYELHDGALVVAGVRLAKGAPLDGIRLRSLADQGQRHIHVAAIRRARQMLIPDGDTTLKGGDMLFFAVPPERAPELMRLCGCVPVRVSKIVIAGAGRITENVLRLLPGHYDIAVIDSDRERCKNLAFKFPHISVVNADVRELPLMRDENVGDADMFMALTGRSEANIVSCMVMRELGVPKTVARIEELQYAVEARELNIDKIINKKLLSSGEIVRQLLDADVHTPHCLALGDAEVAEMVAMEGARITRSAVRDLGLPRGITLASLVREGRPMLVDGDTCIRAGDHVVIFCLPGTLRRAERLFV